MPSIKERLMIVEKLTKNENADNVECINAIAKEVFTALDSLARIADALERIAEIQKGK